MSASAPPLLIHFHIPKNAGTTLGRMMKVKLGFWPVSHALHHAAVLGYYTTPGEGPRLQRINALSDRGKRRVRFFEGHIGFGVHESLPAPSTYITLLREPIDRAISVFHHLKQHQRIDADMAFEDFVLQADPRRVWWVDNAQVRYLAGGDGEIIDVPQGTCERSMLDRALENLQTHFSLIGLVEQFDASIILLRRMLGWRRCYYGTSNIGRRRRTSDPMPQTSLDFIREHNQLDIELYAFAKKRFEERVAAEGASFQDELKRFDAANRRYNKTIGRLYGLLPRGRRMLSRLKIIR